jgi:signal transduction histidine kinase
MRSGADRVREIVQCLQNFSRLDQAGIKRVNIHEGIDNTLLILQHRLHSSGDSIEGDSLNIEVIKQYGNLPLVECYPAQLNQVFMNILINAIDELKNLKLKSNKQITINTEIGEKNLILITIKDNGSGIPLQIQPKVFDPFFTTKPVGKGVGLGLTVSYEIIEQHQGKIKIISEPGQGTEVVIELPQEIKQ